MSSGNSAATDEPQNGETLERKMLIRHEKDKGIIFDTEVGQVLGLWDIDAILPIPNYVDEFGFGWVDKDCTIPYNAVTALTRCGSIDEFQGMDPLDFDFGLE